MPLAININCNLTDTFKDLAFRISTYAKKIGIHVVAYHDESLKFFSALPSQQKNQVIHFLKDHVEIFEMVQSSGKDLKDSKQMTWFAIKKFGLRPPSDLFEHLGDSDVIEIHNEYGQIYRSLNYYGLCSYSIEELSCVHWSLLYKRNDELTNAIMDRLSEAAQKKATVRRPIVEHIVEESASPFKFKINYRHLFTSPLFEIHNPEKALVLIATDASLRERPAFEDEERLLKKYYKEQHALFLNSDAN